MKILAVFLFLIGMPIFAQDKIFDGLIIRFGEDSMQVINHLEKEGFTIGNVSEGKINARNLYERIEVFFTLKTGVYKSIIWGSHENNSFEQEFFSLTSNIKPQSPTTIGRSRKTIYTFKTSVGNNSELTVGSVWMGVVLIQTDLTRYQNINLQESD
ncbi:MAG: hypothetical protein V4642_10905 [Bacteroidota bacterium]